MSPISVIGRTECIRCGECCLRSSPSLQVQDIPRVLDGPIQRSDLYTVRAGELVWDNINGSLKKTEREIIKIREKEGTYACIFYDDPGRQCTIYENRPIQCAAMMCWDDTQFMRVFEGPMADRKDIIQDRALLRLMEVHEERCGYVGLDRHVQAIREIGERAVENILGLLKFDHDIRLMTLEKLGLDASELDLVYGRPLAETIVMFGLKVVREPDGSFFLTLSVPSP